MNRGNSPKSFVLPGEYRRAAERLFPRNGVSKGYKTDMKAVAEFAKALGIGAEYQRLLAMDKNSTELRTYLEHFQNNLDLLIQKTWVEKSDERRKGRLQDEVPLFMTTIENGIFTGAIEKFGAILKELAYLFFGIQSEKEDFSEYTFRIDAQMGLFWWYGGKLASLIELSEGNSRDTGKLFGQKQNPRSDEKFLWAVLLLGICYLTNF